MKYLLILFLLCFLIQQIYYWYLFSSFSFHKTKRNELSQTWPVSVIICAKNEAENIGKHLPSILKQLNHYSELIVVDDHSTDHTLDELKAFTLRYSNLRIISHHEVDNKPGKKAALLAGVKAAKHSCILVTDADCYPTTNSWIEEMTAPLQQENDLVIGFSPNEKGFGFWNNFFRFETFITALQYGSFALRGMPYMAVGRNMAYKKDFFMNHFQAVLKANIASGDDDLLVNFAAQPKTTAVVLKESAMTYSAPPPNLKKWFRQKTRHASAGFKYKWWHKLLLSLFPITGILFFCLFIFFLFTPIKFIAVILILFQFFTFSVIVGFGLKRFNSGDLTFEAPVYLFLWTIFAPVIAIFSAIKPPKHWN